jgi:hypothetical protein
MKLSQDQLDLLESIIRNEFDNVPSRYRSELQRHDYSLELVELAKALKLDDLAEEMRYDLTFENSQDPNEDRENDSDYNNERESNFRNAWK